MIESLPDLLLRIARELPNSPEHPPFTTEDALRQIAATGDKDARQRARAELRRRRRAVRR